MIHRIFFKESAWAALVGAVLLTSCASQDDEYGYIRDVLLRKAGIQIHDSIALLSVTDEGSDLHGSMTVNYRLTITESDFMSILGQIEHDTLHEWIETETGDYVCIIYPEYDGDTLFGVGLLKSKSTIDVNLEQGF